MKVLLLAGGWSSEREVSLKGGEEIAATLRSRGHEVTLCDPAVQFEQLPAIARQHDVAFINLHGKPGEDGLFQAMLDQIGCPYQGSDAHGSILAIHKSLSRLLFREAGLNVPKGAFYPCGSRLNNASEKLEYPVFVKPNTGGSSINLSRVFNDRELDVAMKSLFAIGEDVLLEQAVEGQDISCGVLGDEALDPVMIVCREGFFDFHNKYAEDGAQEICPAPLPAPMLKKIRQAALAAHRALGLTGYSRSDFILQQDGTLYILETNTTPGMTMASILPKEAAVRGISFGDLIEKLLQMGLARAEGR